MLGDRPSKSKTRLLRVATLMVAASAAIAGEACSAPAEPQPTMRLRIAWGGRTAVQWSGHVSASQGELRQMSLLGRECDTPGSLWLENGAALIAQPRPRTFDGFDITVAAPTTATLRVEMRAAGDDSSTIVELPLARVMTDAHKSTITSSTTQADTTLLVHRLDDDALRLHTDRDNLIFAPGETFRCEVEPAIAGLVAGGSLDLSTELLQERRGVQEWSRTERVFLPPRNTTRVPLEIPLPMRAGVYTVKLVARTPPGNRVKFWEASAGQQLARRTFQVVVLDSQTTTSYVDAQWSTLLEIDPGNPKWYNRLPEWTRLGRWTNYNAGPMGSEPFRSMSHGGRALAALSPSRSNAPSWQAYPLPGAEPGQPHVVELDLPDDLPQQVVVRIFEPDPNGKLVPTGSGSGVVVDPATHTGDAALKTHRYLFWPRTISPVAIIQNGSQQATAGYGTIRLRVARGSSSPGSTVDPNARMVAAYYDWQSLIACTSARPPTTDGKPAVDDWLTFYHAAERLAALLEMSGYNTAVVNVMDSGSAAFDLGDYPTLPLLDTSRLASGCNDLPAIDPLDLLMRVFSHRGLRLVPALHFNATLPGVDGKLRRKQYRTLDEYPVWTNLDGQPRWSVRADSRASQPPHYRMPHRDVAAEMREIVGRLVSRTSPYPAFAGVGIGFPGDSYLASPPAEFGVTGPRLAAAARLAGVDQATAESWLRNPSDMLDDPVSRRVWLAARAEANTEFFASLAADIETANPVAKLLLVTPQLHESREYNARPQLIGGQTLVDLYMQRGLDIEALAQKPGIVVPLALHATTGLPLADAAQAMELNDRLRNSNDISTRAALTWTHPAYVPLPGSPEFASPTIQDEAIVFDHLGEATRSFVAHTVYAGATGPLIVGGPLGPGAMGNDFRRQGLELLARLPARSSPADHESFEQPVAVRIDDTANGSTVMVVNDSPWPVTSTVTLDVPQRCTAQAVVSQSGTRPTTTSYTAGRHLWPVELRPYELQALQFTTREVGITGVRLQMPEHAVAELTARCEALERRDLKPDSLATYRQVPNPSFEEVDTTDNAIAWQSTSGVTTVTPGIDGQRTAQLVSTSESARIATEAFPVPATGQIAITGYVKVIHLADDAQLRLVVEEIGGLSQPRHVTISAATLLEHHRTKEWYAYQFGVEDLSLDTRATMLIRVELWGSGELWIDNLQVHDLVYPLGIYPESDQQVLALVQHVKGPRRALEARQYRDCLTMLDSYWSQFLMQHLPEIKPTPTDADAPGTPKASSPSEEPPPRLTDRLRDWFRF